MADAQRIDTILDRIRQIYGEDGPFDMVHRERMKEYSLEQAMSDIETIGKMRSPGFVIDGYNREAYENALKWVHSDESMTCIDISTGKRIKGNLNAGLYVCGNTGSGKSWLLDIMAVYARVCGFRFKSGKKVVPLIWTNVRTDSICDDYAEGESLKKYKKSPIMGFQDLGTEPAETLQMGTRTEVMRTILESRCDDDAAMTLISSNLRPGSEKFVRRYGDRVDSRICFMCNYIELTGPDRRKR